ncbi:hypothetical protein MNNICLKF_02291 [Synechococcus sp. CBW1107]|nr:hypothetical protein MNNICLKF_02291 [Synechococcus sp. CBW1107]
MIGARTVCTHLGLFALCLIWTFLLIAPSLFKGIDFTDQTLNYHFSLRVLDGDIPFKDFQTTVMPFSYWMEALFHWIFGKGFWVNEVMGVVLKGVNLYLSYLICAILVKKKFYAFSACFFMQGVFWAGNQSPYFDFTGFAITLSILSLYFGLKSVSHSMFSFLYGLSAALTLITKQNFGIALLVSFVIYLLIAFVKCKQDRSLGLKKLIFFFAGLTVVLLPFCVYFVVHGSASDVLFILLTGSERKGISALTALEKIHTFIPILNLKLLLQSLISSLIILYVAGFSPLKLKRVCLAAFVVFPLVYLLSGSFALKMILNLFIYDGVKIIICLLLLLVILLPRTTAKHRYVDFFVVTASSLIFVHELGWPGRGYSLTSISVIVLVALPFLLGNLSSSLNIRMTEMLKSSYYFGFGAFLLGASTIVSPQLSLRRDFDAESSLNLPPFYENRATSRYHHDAVMGIIDIYESTCPGEKIFVFPWSPILYTYVGAENPTRFDLPYHDWLVEAEAYELISSLQADSPCLIVVEQSSLSSGGRETPFPAKGMRLVEVYLRGILYSNSSDYRLVREYKTFSKNHLIFKINR